MSTMIHGTIISRNVNNLIYSKQFNFDVVKMCAEEKFGFLFKMDPNNLLLPFIVSENFVFSNCDEFMDFDNYIDISEMESAIEKLKNDISKIKRVFDYILSYDDVDYIVFCMSFGEVGSVEEYTKHTVYIDDFKDVLLNEYLRESYIPSVMLTIYQKSKNH